mgnify:CR=1 FL=1
MIRRVSDMEAKQIDGCHGGVGPLFGRIALMGTDGETGLRFLHDDRIPPGSTIAEHRHDDNEEVYLVVEGSGTLLLDGERIPVADGDVSLVERGHTHGLENTSDRDLRLIVICIG